MKKTLFILLVCLYTMAQGYASTQAKFSIVAHTPTSVIVPANRSTYIEYTVTNNTALTQRLTTVDIPYVSQITHKNSQCAKVFTLAPGRSCKLTFSVAGSAIKSPYFGGPVVCTTQANNNQPNQFVCSQPEPSMILSLNPAPAVPTVNKKLYVTNWDGGSISLCYLISGTLSSCLISATSDTFVNPEALAVNNNQFLFVASIGSSISSCAIHPTSGELSNCKNAAVNQPIYAPTGIAINQNKAYISNSGPEQFHQGITVCDVNNDLLADCTFTQGNATFSIPSDVALLNQTVYVSNFNSHNTQTTYCELAGNFCVDNVGTISGTSNLLNEPEGIVFSSINGSEYVYFTNHGNHTVTLCKVTNKTTFDNCTVTGGYFTGFGNLALVTEGVAKAFIPSGIKQLSICEVNSTNGSLSNCANSSHVSFNNPSGLLIL
jgi:hypothetical protein